MEKIHGLGIAIANVVRQLRDKTGMTQSAFADFAGLSHVYIAQLETEARGASLTALICIGRAVGLKGSEVLALVEHELEKYQ